MRRIWTIVHYSGIGYFGYLLTGYWIPRFQYQLLYAVPRAQLRMIMLVSALIVLGLVLLGLSYIVGLIAGGIILLTASVVVGVLRVVYKRWKLQQMKQKARFLTAQVRATYEAHTFTTWDQWSVEEAVRHKIESYLLKHADQDEVVLGRIDNDGRVLGLFGPLPWQDSVSEDDFVERYRFPLDIVLLDGKILVRKNFRKDRERFTREWHNLAYLYDTANVPAIYRVDESQCVLYKNLIPGRTLRSILVEAGASILTVQTEQDSDLATLASETRLKAVWQRGQSYLEACVPSSFLCQMEQQVDKIHARGVAQLSLTFGNVMMDEATQSPWLIDLEGATYYPDKTQIPFVLRRDQDREKFNQIYKCTLLTERTAREALRAELKTKNGWYAPIDFGKGLAVGGIWSVESGTGRWKVLNEKVVPALVRGKKILDLGSNNGLFPLLMLRAGAEKVVGVEYDPNYVERAHLVHRIFEWHDLRTYPFEVHQGDMLEAVATTEESFDVVTAYCSLYYLSEEDMARVVRRAAQIAPTIILQANDGTRSEAAQNKANKSSSAYLEKLLHDNGYDDIQVYAPSNYPRPLLVGQRAD